MSTFNDMDGPAVAPMKRCQAKKPKRCYAVATVRASQWWTGVHADKPLLLCERHHEWARANCLGYRFERIPKRAVSR